MWTTPGGLSVTGLTMQGDVNMSGHNVVGLVDPTRDDMAVSKGYTDNNFLDIAGGVMVGDIGMKGHDVTHLSGHTTYGQLRREQKVCGR